MTARLRRPGRLAGIVAAAAAGLIAPSPATAAWNPASLASVTATEQGLTASGSARVSGDGRYVLFSTTARNFAPEGGGGTGSYRSGGLFRKDLATGALEVVALGNRFAEGDTRPTFAGAGAGWMSADGRRIAFATQERLSPADTNDVFDVYVRDMAQGRGSPAAYELASALDATVLPPTYDVASGGATVPFSGNALSADGRTVVFTVAGASDLPAGGAATPADQTQLYVRDLELRRTRLVSARRDPDTGRATADPAGGVQTGSNSIALSADGTAVAWTATGAADQARSGGTAPAPDEAHFLWRRLADGPTAPSRRLTGIDDPDDAGCPADAGSAGSPACAGPLQVTGSDVNSGAATRATSSGPVALSPDGYTAAFASDLAPREVDPAVAASAEGVGSDLFLTDMRPGTSRKAGIRELTRGVPGANGEVDGMTFSGDGRTLAFATERIRFALSTPTLVSQPSPSQAGNELYALDLPSQTFELVTRAFDGGKPNSTTSAEPSLTSDGSRIAFASAASNLVRGDGNEASDAFFADRERVVLQATTQSIPPPPAPIAVTPAPVLRVTARSLSDGRIRLVAVTPGGGALSASARSRVARVVRIRPRGSRRAVRRRVVSERRVATGRAAAPSAGAQRVDLRVSKAFRSRLRKGLRSTIRVTFRASGAAPLTADVRAQFRSKARRRAAAPEAAR